VGVAFGQEILKSLLSQGPQAGILLALCRQLLL